MDTQRVMIMMIFLRALTYSLIEICGNNHDLDSLFLQTYIVYEDNIFLSSAEKQNIYYGNII